MPTHLTRGHTCLTGRGNEADSPDQWPHPPDRAGKQGRLTGPVATYARSGVKPGASTGQQQPAGAAFVRSAGRNAVTCVSTEVDLGIFVSLSALSWTRP